jgi:DNA-binding PadR family transcriptional regulator
MPQHIPDAWRALPTIARDALVVLAHHNKCIASTVSEGMGHNPSNHVGNCMNGLRTLEEHGYVESENADDVPGPSRYWRITGEGWALLRDANIQVDV